MPTQESYDLIRPHTSAPREFSEREIVARMMVPMATELARCLEEGVVASAAEADMALIYGLGFPPFRGGIFRWLDIIGLPAFAAMAEPYESLGELYQLTEGIRGHLADNTVYYPF